MKPINVKNDAAKAIALVHQLKNRNFCFSYQFEQLLRNHMENLFKQVMLFSSNLSSRIAFKTSFYGIRKKMERYTVYVLNGLLPKSLCRGSETAFER